jgi:WD40 repeat protein
VKEGGAEHTPYRGHSSHVTCVRWLSLGRDRQGCPTDDYLLSTGGEDKCVFQWRNTDTGADARPPGAAGSFLKRHFCVQRALCAPLCHSQLPTN